MLDKDLERVSVWLGRVFWGIVYTLFVVVYWNYNLWL